MFYEIDRYEPVVQMVHRIRGVESYFLGLLDKIAEDLIQWPQDIHNGLWTVYPLKWQGKVEDPRWQWLEHPGVRNAGFSVLLPGAVIEPHTGFTTDALRLHYGLRCPPGDCAIRVGDDVRMWANGEALLFDDMVEHEAWNHTHWSRAILLMDLERKAFGLPDA